MRGFRLKWGVWVSLDLTPDSRCPCGSAPQEETHGGRQALDICLACRGYAVGDEEA